MAGRIKVVVVRDVRVEYADVYLVQRCEGSYRLMRLTAKDDRAVDAIKERVALLANDADAVFADFKGYTAWRGLD